jgi:hypothetical protein
MALVHFVKTCLLYFVLCQRRIEIHVVTTSVVSNQQERLKRLV